jgi:hypothetical protein
LWQAGQQGLDVERRQQPGAVTARLHAESTAKAGEGQQGQAHAASKAPSAQPTTGRINSVLTAMEKTLAMKPCIQPGR